MTEFFIFLIIMLGLGVYDLRKMAEANLKKEVFPYLALSLLAGAVGLIYLAAPLGPSLAKIMFDLFNIKE